VLARGCAGAVDEGCVAQESGLLGYAGSDGGESDGESKRSDEFRHKGL
jgi:hypothetical protein